jgi:hypothetical protein
LLTRAESRTTVIDGTETGQSMTNRPREQRQPRQTALSACHGGECAEVIPRGQLFCERCDAALLDETRALIVKLHRPGERWTFAFKDAMQRAQTEIEYARKTGHRLEQTAKFDW